LGLIAAKRSSEYPTPISWLGVQIALPIEQRSGKTPACDLAISAQIHIRSVCGNSFTGHSDGSQHPIFQKKHDQYTTIVRSKTAQIIPNRPKATRP